MLSDSGWSLVPFAAAIVLCLLAPLTDQVVWKATYTEFYRDAGYPGVANLTTGAEWVADMAGLLPAYVLSWLGLVLSIPKDTLFSAVLTPVLATVIVVIIPIIFAAYHSRKPRLHRNRRLGSTPYSLEQWSVVGFNAACLVVVLLVFRLRSG